MTNWNDINVKPSPDDWVLLAINTYYPHVVIACWTPKFTEENNEWDNDNLDYHEERDQYYTPEGWYQQAPEDCEYSGHAITGVEFLAWAELPKYSTQQQ